MCAEFKRKLDTCLKVIGHSFPDITDFYQTNLDIALNTVF